MRLAQTFQTPALVARELASARLRAVANPVNRIYQTSPELGPLRSPAGASSLATKALFPIGSCMVFGNFSQMLQIQVWR